MLSIWTGPLGVVSTIGPPLSPPQACVSGGA
jgi:hypothetical protein